LSVANNINSIGNLTIQPETANTTIGVGTGAGTLSVNDADLTWGQILTIGSATAGNMDIDPAATFANPANFLAGAGSITLGGTVTSTRTPQGRPYSWTQVRIPLIHDGASAINPGSGRWLSYSTNPAADMDGGLSYAFRRFDGSCPAVPAAGNRFLYSYQPTLTATPAQVNLDLRVGPALTVRIWLHPVGLSRCRCQRGQC
jgi:hypothetical protein